VTDIVEGLDPKIARIVHTLRDSGVETFESCQGGSGHSFLEPTVRFHGELGEGFRALGVALLHGFPVTSLRRCWAIYPDGEPVGPQWELTFSETALAKLEES
jgi:hypothetical protein